MSKLICKCERPAPKYYRKSIFGKYKEYCERCWGFVRKVSKQTMIATYRRQSYEEHKTTI